MAEKTAESYRSQRDQGSRNLGSKLVSSADIFSIDIISLKRSTHSRIGGVEGDFQCLGMMVRTDINVGRYHTEPYGVPRKVWTGVVTQNMDQYLVPKGSKGLILGQDHHICR